MYSLSMAITSSVHGGNCANERRTLADARDRLIERMAEYKAHTGWRVIVVFDAHLVPGVEKKKRHHDVEVVFTRENETADERIEKLVSELSGRRVQIHVATSDLTEQWVIFAQGALRKSARELEIEMNEIDKLIIEKSEGNSRAAAVFKDSPN